MTPKRREKRNTHLDASAVPVERALLARAAVLDQEAADAEVATVSWLADEFRKLAEELHYW